MANIGGQFELTAKQKAGNIEGWEAFHFTRVDPEILRIKGGVPRINRRGKKTWNGCETATVFVHRSEVEKVGVQYVTDTGNCWDCLGEGRERIGWSAATGPRYKPCEACEGTGKAKV